MMGSLKAMTPAKKRRKTGNDGLCLFCMSGADNPQKFGQRLEKDGITVHYFCMLFASGLSQNGKSDKEGILGFLMRDIFCEVKRGRRLRCTYCKKTGATVGCVKSNCRRAFHFGCGRENGALSQFFGNFSSYCQDHCPKQVVPVRDRQVFHGTANSICAICMCAVEARASNSTLRAPCCKNAWFHRNCMQRQAIYSGIHFFKCALCNNKDMFQDEMLTFGIYIPDQDAAWELEPNAYHDLLERHSQCDVKRCLCNQGRRYNKDSSNWEIILCDWCGSKGTHIICSAVKSSGTNWICEDCSNVASKMGSTKKTSHSKKPQIDEWIKKKFASFSRHSKEKPAKRKRPLNTDRQSHNIKKRCCTHALPNISASAGCIDNNESTAWKKPSCTYTASSATQEAMSSQRSSPTKKAATATRKQVYGHRRQRILRKNLQDCYDVNDDPSSLERQQGHIVGCVIPASMSVSTSSSKLSVGASKEDFEGKPRWYRRLMTEDYLTGRKLGAQMVKWTDDLWNIKNAEQGQNAKCCSTALGSVDSEPSASVTTATTTSAVSSDNEDVETCQHDVAAVSRMETNVQNPSETDMSPAAESIFTHIIDRPPAYSLTVSDIDSNCDSGTVEILPICEDYRSVLEDSQPLYDPKAGLFGTCSWDDRDANCLRLSYCPPIEIDLTQDIDITNSCLAIGGQTQKTPEFIDLTELQELSEQDAWSETGTDSGIGEPRMMFDPPSLSRSSDVPPLLSRAPDGPPVLTPSVTLPQESEYGGRVYHAPLVHVGYFTLGPVTSYR